MHSYYTKILTYTNKCWLKMTTDNWKFLWIKPTAYREFIFVEYRDFCDVYMKIKFNIYTCNNLSYTCTVINVKCISNCFKFTSFHPVEEC